MDAPLHFVKNGKSIDTINLNRVIGKAYVVEYNSNSQMSLDFIQNTKIPKGISKIIFKTLNSHGEMAKTFNKDFIAISSTVADYLVAIGIDLVGIDGPSIQSFSDANNKTHEILLENEVIILEGLNLREVKQGIYNLIALPMKIANAEGAPIRAILTKGNIL
jgi:arylformamidase